MDSPLITQLAIAVLLGIILGYFIFRKSTNNSLNSGTGELNSNNSQTPSPTNILKMALKGPINNAEELNKKVLELIKAEGLIHAIKLVQKNTKLGLVESKNYVEALRDGKPVNTNNLF